MTKGKDMNETINRATEQLYDFVEAGEFHRPISPTRSSMTSKAELQSKSGTDIAVPCDPSDSHSKQKSHNQQGEKS
jgi:hypothetical protein